MRGQKLEVSFKKPIVDIGAIAKKLHHLLDPSSTSDVILSCPSQGGFIWDEIEKAKKAFFAAQEDKHQPVETMPIFFLPPELRNEQKDLSVILKIEFYKLSPYYTCCESCVVGMTLMGSSFNDCSRNTLNNLFNVLSTLDPHFKLTNIEGLADRQLNQLGQLGRSSKRKHFTGRVLRIVDPEPPSRQEREKTQQKLWQAIEESDKAVSHNAAALMSSNAGPGRMQQQDSGAQNVNQPAQP